MLLFLKPMKFYWSFLLKLSFIFFVMQFLDLNLADVNCRMWLFFTQVQKKNQSVSFVKMSIFWNLFISMIHHSDEKFIWHVFFLSWINKWKLNFSDCSFWKSWNGASDLSFLITEQYISHLLFHHYWTAGWIEKRRLHETLAVFCVFGVCLELKTKNTNLRIKRII